MTVTYENRCRTRRSLLSGLVRRTESTLCLGKNIEYKMEANPEKTVAEQTSENDLLKDPEDISECGLA